MYIGLDFDGVISDCGQLKSEGAKKLYGIDIPPSQFKKELVIEGGLLSAQQYRNLQKIVYATREIGFSMKPVDNVFLYLPKILANGHKLKIITSREGNALEIAEDWTRAHGMALEFVGVGYAKSKLVAASGLDMFIDDDFDKLKPLVGAIPNLFLYSWDYNQHIDVGSAAKRVFSWKEIYQNIQLLSQE